MKFDSEHTTTKLRGKEGKKHAEVWDCYHCKRSRALKNEEAKPWIYWVVVETKRGPKRHAFYEGKLVCMNTRAFWKWWNNLIEDLKRKP